VLVLVFNILFTETGHAVKRYTIKWVALYVVKQKAQLSQRDHVMLRVIKYFNVCSKTKSSAVAGTERPRDASYH